MAVIFVHGILSSGATAWGDPSWPELLQEDPQLQGAGIYVFSYRTSLRSRTYSIADAADALREHITIDRIWTYRKIAFVCHSMGGIVVRRFLVANQSRLIDLKSTVGLFLVASPSLGSRDASMLSVLSYVLQHTQAATLRFSQTNTSLDELHRDFRTLLYGGKLRIVGRELVEDCPILIKRLLGFRTQVVEPFAAAAYFHQPGMEPLRIPGSDHSSIVKPQSANALQHRALIRFLNEFKNLEELADPVKSAKLVAEAATGDASPPEPRGISPVIPDGLAKLDPIAEAAISPDHREVLLLINGKPGLEHKRQAALKLRSGKMLERVLASLLIKSSDDPVGAFTRTVAEGAHLATVDRIASWLRFASPAAVRILNLDGLIKGMDLNEVDSTRLKATCLGWLGEHVLPMVDWDDKYCREKYAFTFAEAYLHAAWAEQSDNSLFIIASQLLICNEAYKTYRGDDLLFFDLLNRMRGIPKSNAKLLLTEFRKRGATENMLEAMLSTLASAPTADALNDICILIDHPSPAVAEKAREALALIPAHSSRVRDAKRVHLEEGTTQFTAAVGTDLMTEHADQLLKKLDGERAANPAIYAAWALSRLSEVDPEARGYLLSMAREHPDKLIRSICLIGVAKHEPRQAESLISGEFESSRNLERLFLGAALTYITDAREMLKHLATADESEVYVPMLLPCLQNLIWDAMLHASQRSPILAQLATLADDA